MDQPQQQQKGWFGRNWLWVVPVGCLLPLLMCGGGIAAIFFGVASVLESSDVYVQSVAAARANPEVVKLLGEPINGSFPGGNLEVNNGVGKADLRVPISGPKGKGTVHSVASKDGGPWKYEKMEFTAEASGQQIDLRPGLPK